MMPITLDYMHIYKTLIGRMTVVSKELESMHKERAVA
jgi:hypothetical protein